MIFVLSTGNVAWERAKQWIIARSMEWEQQLIYIALRSKQESLRFTSDRNEWNNSTETSD